MLSVVLYALACLRVETALRVCGRLVVAAGRPPSQCAVGGLWFSYSWLLRCMLVVAVSTVLRFRISEKMDFKKFTAGAGTLFNRAKQV